jgi:G:T-mismatch repair DNA endonuclease (very short patch repair protein)
MEYQVLFKHGVYGLNHRVHALKQKTQNSIHIVEKITRKIERKIEVGCITINVVPILE